MPRRAPAQLDAEGLYQRAVRLLARRSRSRAELQRLLRPRADRPASLEQALARLADHGYLDDRRFAEGLARYQHDQEKFGSQRVARELRRRGVEAGVAEAALRQVYAPRAEARLLAEYARKKRLRRPEDPRAAAQLFRRLRMAGFAGAAVCDFLRRWKLDPEWLEGLSDAAGDDDISALEF